MKINYKCNNFRVPVAYNEQKNSTVVLENLNATQAQLCL